MDWAFFPFSTLPAPCSIVWCRFPYVEDPSKPGPKPRPALVKRASADNDGNPWVHVAYGTTRQVFRNTLDDFTVSNVEEMDHSGLWCATRFRLDRVELLPWAEEFFYPAPGRSTPVMGRLTQHSARLLGFQAAMRQRRDEERQARLDLEDGEQK